IAETQKKSIAEVRLVPTGDPRMFLLRSKSFGGDVVDAPLEIRVPVHFGAWNATKLYGLGDEVAWNGCSWRCARRGSDEEPGRSSPWLLVAKQGRSSKG